MALQRWDRFRELEDMGERLNRLFWGRPLSFRGEGAMEARETLAEPEWTPAVDIGETDSEYLIQAELPGVKKEDVKVTVENGILSIQGERRQDKEEKGRKVHRVERCYGSFLRTFTVPENVEADRVRAEYKDGVLTVALPKSEKAKPKAIEVSVQG